MAMDVQKELFTSQWGACSQQQIFHGEPKVERPCRICYYLLQKDSCQEVSVDSSIYKSYSSDNEESNVDFQEGCPSEKWVVKYQQQVSLGKAKVGQ